MLQVFRSKQTLNHVNIESQQLSNRDYICVCLYERERERESLSLGGHLQNQIIKTLYLWVSQLVTREAFHSLSRRLHYL